MNVVKIVKHRNGDATLTIDYTPAEIEVLRLQSKKDKKKFDINYINRKVLSLMKRYVKERGNKI